MKMQRNREPKDSDTPAGTNIRAAERYRLSLPTMMWELGGPRDSAVAGETVDISRSGMFLSGQFPLRPGSMISFEVKLPAVGDQPGGTMVGQATVVRNESATAGRRGIGAIIHQCEVWPAARATRVLAQRQGAAQRRGGTSAENRTGRDRRKAERRSPANKRRRAALQATERRKRARRALASRRKN